MNNRQNKKFNSAEIKTAFKLAFPKTLPVFAGYLVLGFGFGLLLQSKGYSFWWAILMSITIYGGSMQYVGVNLLASGAGIITTAIISVMIQARHLFYGLTLLSKYEKVGKVKPYLIFGVTDETYSVICSTEVPKEANEDLFYFFVTLLDQCYWIIGGAIGAIFGQLVDINTKGVDFSMTSLFIVLLVDNLLKQKTRLPAIIGLVVSLICLLIFGPGGFLIPAMVGIAVILIILKPKLSGSEEVAENN